MQLLSDEHQVLYDAATRFATAEFDPADQLHRLQHDEAFSWERWRTMAELGWLATCVGEAHGGLALAPSYLSVLAEALGPSLMTEPLLSQVAFGVGLLNALQDNDARRDVLRSCVAGNDLIAFGMSRGTGADSGVGSEIRGRRNKDMIHIDRAQALFVDGHSATYLLLPVSLDEQTAPVLCLLPTATTGVELTTHRAIDGRSVAMARLSNVILDGAKVLEFVSATPHVIEDATVLYHVLVCSESVGIAQATLNRTIEYVHEREQFGQKIADFQVLQHRLVDMHLAMTRIQSLLSLVRHKIDTIRFADSSPFVAALVAGVFEDALFIAQEAVQLHGAIAMTDEYVLAHYLKRLTVNQMLVGGKDRHLETVATQLVRL